MATTSGWGGYGIRVFDDARVNLGDSSNWTTTTATTGTGTTLSGASVAFAMRDLNDRREQEMLYHLSRKFEHMKMMRPYECMAVTDKIHALAICQAQNHIFDRNGIRDWEAKIKANAYSNSYTVHIVDNSGYSQRAYVDSVAYSNPAPTPPEKPKEDMKKKVEDLIAYYYKQG